MASFTTTTAAKFIPEIWSKEVILARESRLYMANLIMRLDTDVDEMGNKIHLPNVSNLTASDIGSDGSLTDTAPTETEVVLTLTSWKGVSINVPDIVMAQSKYDLLKLYAEKMGYALAVIVEQSLLGQYSSLTTNTAGTAGVDISDAELRLAVQRLDDARAPFEDRHLVIKPVQKNALLGIDKFVRYDSVPYAKGESPTIKGDLGELYGVAIHVSPEVLTVSGETQNMMWQHDAFALAMQKDIKVEKFARTQFADRLGAS
jgi:N4-gp56 family major capsid protein